MCIVKKGNKNHKQIQQKFKNILNKLNEITLMFYSLPKGLN